MPAELAAAEPLWSAMLFAAIVIALCVGALGYALGYDLGHRRASAEAKAWRDAVAAQIRAATGSYAYPPEDAAPAFERLMRRARARWAREEARS